MARSILAAYGLAAVAAAAPSPSSISTPAQLSQAISSLRGVTGTSFFSQWESIYRAIKPQATPSSSQEVASRVAAAYAAYPSNPNAVGAALLMSGAAGSALQPTGVPGLYPTCNLVNNNPREPAQPIYPKKQANDAPYDVSEEQLRSAIFIPDTFTYGQKKPVIFVPGTGVNACENFQPNYGKTLANVDYADPVYLNIPGNQLADIQTNSEYIAYAANYISGISNNRNVSYISWSAGAIGIQWALKYWPSTDPISSEVFVISADYDGTILAPLICPGTGFSPGFPCPPSIYQQFYNSKFIRTLKSRNGDSAYVPTTSFRTIFDEIVEPQQNPIASAMINDARARGIFNAQVQGDVCPATSVAAAPNFGHEAMLFNAVGYYLAVDGLQNNGPSNLARSMATDHCMEFMQPGMNLADVFATEAIIPIAGFNVFTYPDKVTQEPPIKDYARRDAPILPFGPF